MEVRNLSFAYGQNQVLKDVSFKIAAGSVTTLLGSNGSGKSTLFSLMTKNRVAQRGSVLLDGRDIRQIRLADFARKVALVSQTNSVDGGIGVKKLVEYGRTPYLSAFKRLDDEDKRIVQWALEKTGITHYREQPVAHLSSGQQQRVWVALALAQKTDILFLDEPTTYLDVHNQVEILRMIRRLNQELGITIVMILHDMNQAIHYSDEILGLKEGRIIVQGKPQEVFCADLVEELFAIRLPLVEYDNSRFVLQV
jgi:iron complex transport system ATP-binding protein